MEWLALDWSALLREFNTLLVVIDPVGTIPVYLFAVASVPATLHRRFAICAVAIATLVLLAFLIGGQAVLETLGLRLGSFQIAGGIILATIAVDAILGGFDALDIFDVAPAENPSLLSEPIN